jgi:hypothetical protein
MRSGAWSIGVVLIAAVVWWASAPWVFAQDTPRPRVTLVIKSSTSAPASTAKPAAPVPGQPQRPVQPTLRKPIGAPAALPPTRTPVSLALAAPGPKGGVTPLRGLNPPSASAQASQCRAQCAKARYVCTAEEGGDCDTVWGECVVRCSGANFTETPDLASSAVYRPKR